MDDYHDILDGSCIPLASSIYLICEQMMPACSRFSSRFHHFPSCGIVNGLGFLYSKVMLSCVFFYLPSMRLLYRLVVNMKNLCGSSEQNCEIGKYLSTVGF